MQLKEVKVRPFTDKHDLEIKIRKVKRFLEERNKAKITITFRGRERAHKDTANGIMDAFIEGVKDIGVVENPPRREGDSVIMIISPKPESQKGKKSSNPSTPQEGGVTEGRENE